MSIISVILALLNLTILPIFAGCGIVCAGKDFGRKTFGGKRKIIFSWLFGQLILWCVFQFLAVYDILKEHSFRDIEKKYLIAMGIVCAISLAVFAVSFIRSRKVGKLAQNNTATTDSTGDTTNGNQTVDSQKRPWEYIIIAIVILGLIVQVVLQIALAYMEVDDSYYVSEATTAIESEKLYFNIPYTGVTTSFDPRHGLAPFPIWLALISHTSKMEVVSMAHVMMPVVFLLITYAVYALFGYILLGEKKRYLPIFMLFTELLVTFGFYSYMTPEKFFITRLREGKATLASLILPGIIMCLYLILKSLKEDKKTDLRLYFLLLFLNGAGCLCSTMGALLCVIPIGVCAIFACFMFKRARHLLPMVISCLPSLIFALMYLKLG